MSLVLISKIAEIGYGNRLVVTTGIQHLDAETVDSFRRVEQPKLCEPPIHQALPFNRRIYICHPHDLAVFHRHPIISVWIYRYHVFRYAQQCKCQPLNLNAVQFRDDAELLR